MLKRKVLRAARLTEDRLRQLLRIHDRPERLERSAQDFWSRPIGEDNSFWWHARGSTPFAGSDDEKWQMIGRRHTTMWHEFARSVNVVTPVKKIVDWGCGGGANAVAFASECEEMWCTDVSAEALNECKRQVEATGAACRVHPLQIQVPDPEAALKVIPHDIDLFHCLYVFEVFPSQEYGARVLRIAHQLLKPGGIAFIQIKYETESWQTRSRKWGYTRGVAHMTSYRVEQFWQVAEACGFEPKSMTLLPKPPEVPDTRYAYYFLHKPNEARG